jgi:hypothetical protein
MRFDFGVLPTPFHVQWPGWAIEPLDDYPETIAEWQSRGPDRHWVLPPLVQTIRERWDRNTHQMIEEQVPGSERQAVTWRVPATHSLIYRGNRRLDGERAKQGVATFIIYLVATVCGVELQHADWYVTGRQRKTGFGLFLPRRGAPESVLETATDWFRHATRRVQVAIISSLYLHNHVQAFHWDWERFAWQYSAFDGAYFVAVKSGAIAPPLGRKFHLHKDRFREFAKAFGMHRSQRRFDQWVNYRNDLIHQVTWGKTIPGHRVPAWVRRAQLPLRSFTTIAVLAAVGYRGPSLRARWSNPVRFSLDP